jgi:hypothetical protein
LLETFYKRAIEGVDAQAGLLVVKILERKANLLGLDSPQKLDIIQVQAEQAPSSYDKIHAAIMGMVEREPPARRAAIKRIDQLGAEEALARLNASNGHAPSAVDEPSDPDPAPPSSGPKSSH